VSSPPPSPSTPPSETADPANPGPEPPTKPSCNLLVDPAGDGTWGPVRYDALDITSADVASDGERVVVHLRLSGLDDVPAAGVKWAFGWTLGTRSYAAEAARTANGDSARLRITDDGGETTADPVSFLVDVSARRIVWVFSRASVPEADGRFHSLHATTWHGSEGALVSADVATSSSTYQDRQPSCVKTS
jgi:hypothetical protein